MISALQIESLLTWLMATLRADATLLSKLGITDVNLACASALELEPVGYGDNGLVVNVTEFPFLCARETSATTIYQGPIHGQEAECKLWYGIKTPIGDMNDTHPVPHRAHADRWLRTVYWRMLYWLRKHVRVDIEDIGTPPVATPVSYDVMTIGQIHTLGLPAMVRYRHIGDVSLFEADFKMTYILPPWAMTDPTDFDAIEYKLGDQEDPAEGTYVESEVDLT